ncbi:WD repeat-containing protein 5 [Drosophila obscura]|uniref:WD repeat-containing protein 5 n=1 Tax=Drosophila obscura TaxID=7282 RepID=UPI001BB133D4|nr:WD repeat-containing protein 5 [Drosophila obscura]
MMSADNQTDATRFLLPEGGDAAAKTTEISELASDAATAPTTSTASDQGGENAFKMPMPPGNAAKNKQPNYFLKDAVPGHKSSVASLKFSADGDYLVSASADCLLKLWDVRTLQSNQTLAGHAKGINHVVCSPNGKLLGSGSDDKTVKLWDPNTNSCVKTLQGHTNYVFCCCFNPQSNLIATASFDGSVHLWDLRTGRILKGLRAHGDPTTSVDFNRNGSHFITSSHDGFVRMWETATFHLVKTLITDDDNPVVGHAKFSPNGKYILTSNFDSTHKLWNYEKSKVLRRYTGHKNESYCLNANFSITAGMWIVSGSEDKSLCIWNLQSSELVQKIDTNGDLVICTDCHPKENIIATGSLVKPFTVKAWKSCE